ncbi:MAG: OmpA family protein [Deltaproteobacteria bacterium]|nr:OmpA family protein [Deltaproteobacteria bacterium]
MESRVAKATLWYIALLGVGLGACATKQGTGAAIGAGSGAALGAGIGALAGGGQGALLGGAIGAGVGAGSGALIGRYMDKQEEDLKKVKGANIERQGDKLVVRFNSAILFDKNKAELKPKSKTDLGEFADVLKKYPETDLVIEGHTDNTGKKVRNQKLSVLRAEAVIAYLGSSGVGPQRMTGRGFADDHPVADNKNDDGRKQNRRVEVKIEANQKLKQQEQQQTAAPR